MKKIITITVACSFVFAPLAFAQEAIPTDVSVAPEPIGESVAVTTSDAPVDFVVAESDTIVDPIDSPIDIPADAVDPAADESAAILQDATSAQGDADSSVLETTVDPSASSTAEAIPVATSTPDAATEDSATSTVIRVESAPEDVAPIPTESIPVEAVQPHVVETIIPEMDLPGIVEPERERPVLLPEPEPSYVFVLSGKTIPTTRTSKNNPRVQETVTGALVPEIDNIEGSLAISGACASPYFVVLIFKDQDDYANDPRSYIVNRAYPCENSSFSYSIDDLPPTLDDGTYYLLVAEQGDTGPWSPITGLTEISINRKQQ